MSRVVWPKPGPPDRLPLAAVVLAWAAVAPAAAAASTPAVVISVANAAMPVLGRISRSCRLRTPSSADSRPWTSPAIEPASVVQKASARLTKGSVGVTYCHLVSYLRRRTLDTPRFDR